MAYTIPPGNKVAYPFTSGTPYTIPLGNKVAFRFGGLPGTVFAVGWDSALFGSASIVNTTTQLFVQGIDDGLVSLNLVVTKSLLAQGFTTMLFGQQAVRNNTTIASPSGFAPNVFGTAWASYYTRFLTPSGWSSEAYGVAQLSGGVRNAQMNGFATQAMGTPSITFQLRQLFPQWFVDTSYGTPVMGYDRPVAATGFDSAAFGDAEVFDNTIHCNLTGFDAAAFGATEAYLYTRTVQAKSVADLDINNIGFPHVFNRTHYVIQSYRSTDWIEGGVADPLTTSIRNVNRVVDLVGNGIAPVFRQVSINAEVVNGARAYDLVGFDATVWGSGTFIAPRVRTVGPQGFEPIELSSRFHIVRNAAFQILPVGTDTSAVGTPPLVVNTRRSFYVGGLGQTAEFGLPFIAPGVRTIGPQNNLEPVRGLIGGATVWFRVRQLTQLPPDFPFTAFGVPTLDIHRNDVFAKSIPPTWQWGTPSVRNNTPEVRPLWDSDSFTRFGATAVFNRWNYYPMQGDVLSAFGLVLIEYRTKTVSPPGFDALRPNLLHRIQKLTPDPPATQNVNPAGLGDQLLMSGPLAKSNALFPPGFTSDAYGQTVLENRGIFVAGIAPPIDDGSGTQFGVPTLPMRQTARPDGFLSEGHGKPILDPLTIWAPTGAPDQAISNHGGIGGTTIDWFLSQNDIRPVWGQARVENKNRAIAANTLGDESSFGQTKVTLKIQYVFPDGQRFGKYGYPELFGGNRALILYGFDLASYGAPRVDHVEPRNRKLTVNGLNPLVFGTPWVSNFIRTLPVPGLNATLFGSTIVQRPPPPALPNGLDATLWGAATFIAYRIRTLAPVGLDSFVMDYVLGNFRDRLRVRGNLTRENVSAGDLLAMGTPSLDQGTRPLFVPGWSGASGRPSVRRINRVDIVSAGRHDTYGETWVMGVIPGTIQPRGEDFAQLGQPRFVHTANVLGWTGELGAVRVGRPVGAEGFDPSQFGQVVAMGFGCGRQARVMRGWDSASIGAASVGGV
jgi:hypothetical protein